MANDEEPEVIDPAAEVTGALDKVRGLFEALRPRESYEIEDLYGNKYKFRPVMPAAKMIDASLMVDDLIKLVPPELLAKARAQREDLGDFRAALWFISQAMSTPGVPEGIHGLWDLLQPRALRGARAAAIEDMGEADAPSSALELFELDAIVEGLLPFFARAAIKSTEAMQRFATPTTDAASA